MLYKIIILCIIIYLLSNIANKEKLSEVVSEKIYELLEKIIDIFMTNGIKFHNFGNKTVIYITSKKQLDDIITVLRHAGLIAQYYNKTIFISNNKTHAYIDII